MWPNKSPRSQPHLALPISLSRLISRVGGGSDFEVRPTSRMKRFLILAFVSLGFVNGCTSTSQPARTTYSLVQQDVTLNRTKPTARLGQYLIQLLSIAEDGTTQIRVGQTDRVLSARPGQCFVSDEFGRDGLQLLSASKSTGTATMISRGCISR